MVFTSVLVSALLTSTAAAANCANALKPANDATLAKGWTYQVVANGFTKPRGLLFDKDGGLLVVDSGSGLVHLSLKDDGNTCVSVDKNTTLIASKALNHGLALSGDGKTLYASSASSVYAWAYDSKAVKVGSSNRTLVGNMSNSDHTTRTLLISQKQPNTLLVSRGSQSNEDKEAGNLNSGHSQIRSFDLAKQGDQGAAYDFLDGHILGWGLRNSVGVAEHPTTGGIWSVENSVDQLARKGKDIHQDNPAEELNYHGTIDKPDGKDQGGNYGYPFCYAIWGTKDFPDLGKLNTADQFPDDDVAKEVTDDMCNSKYVAPRLAFQAHTAPLDIKFNNDGSTAYVTFHGSWDRNDPVGYRISTIDFKDGQPTAARTSTDAAKDIIWAPDLSKCPSKCFRPVGLAWDSKGRLWFSSDSTGEIFVMQKDSSSGGNSGAGRSRSPAWALTSAMAVLIGLVLA